MRRGESLDCKGESVDPMAVRVEGGGEADKEKRCRASRAVVDSKASACAGLTVL